MLFSYCEAQQITDIYIPNSNPVTLQEFWNLNILNSFEFKVKIILQLKLSRQTGIEVYSATSSIIELQQGINIIDHSKILSFEQSFLNNEFKKELSNSNILPDGNYLLCVSIISPSDNNEITIQCIEIKITKNTKKSFSDKKNEPLKISGQTNISFFFTNYIPINSKKEPLSCQTNSSLIIDLFGLPLMSSIIFSTEQTNFKNDINKFNISFNSNTYLNELKQKLTDKILFEQDQISIQNKNLQNSINELNNLNKKLDQPQIKIELNQLDKINQLQHKIDTTHDRLEILKLKEYLNQLKELNLKANGYNRIIERKKELEDQIAKNKNQITESKNNFDIKKLDNQKVLNQKLKEYNLLKRSTKYLLYVKKFELGSSSPNLTSLTLQNSTITGIYTVLQPSFFYFTVLSGKLNNNFINSEINKLLYKRRIIALGFGVGKKEFSHLHLHLLSFEDDLGTLYHYDTLLINKQNPSSNKVLSTDVQLNFIKNRIILKAELTGSQLINNKLLSTKSETLVDSQLMKGYSDNKKWIYNIIKQKNNNLNAVVDYAWNVNITTIFYKTGTTIDANIQRIGVNYESFGITYLRKDIIRNNFSVNQSLLKNKIKIKTFCKIDEFDLNHLNSTESYYLYYGINISINFPKIPFFRFSMNPVTIVNDSNHYDLKKYDFSSGYSYHVGKSQLSTNLIYNLQQSDKNSKEWSFSNQNLSLIQSIYFSQTFAINLTLSYLGFTINDSSGEHINVGFNIFYNKRNWQNQLGGNTNIILMKKNILGIYYQLSFATSKFMSLQFRIGRNTYENILNKDLQPEYKQWIIKAGLNLKF